jgi:acetyl-CoA synthetase
MTLEAVAIYLGGIKAGMDLVTIADSFTPNEIAIRLKITNPDLLFTADVINRSGKILPLYDKIKKAGAPATVVLNDTDLDVVRLRNEDMNWSEFLVENRTFTSVKSDPDKAITTLFSSGTTGEPKAIPWTHTTPIKSASDAYYHHNVQPGDVFCWPTNLGWMMGPWLVFASLINKAAIGLYYGAPTDSAFGAFVEKAEVNILGVIPSFVKHWKQTKCMESFNWERIKCFSSTGEVSNPSDMTYLMKLARNKPVIEYCGGTEIGGGYVTSTVVQTNIPSTFSTQALGGEFVLLDENNQPAELGEVFLIPPVMGLSTRLVNRDHHEVYYKGTPTFKGQTLRRHGDQMQQRINGYYKASGRVDDAMNLGGIKVSSVQIESVLNQLDFIKECAAVSVPPKGGGPEELIVFYVELDNIVTIDDRLFAARDLIKKELNPLFKLVDLRVIDELPRTASNKVMRRKLRDQYRKD